MELAYSTSGNNGKREMYSIIHSTNWSTHNQNFCKLQASVFSKTKYAYCKKMSFDILNCSTLDIQTTFLHAQNFSFSEDKLFQKAYSFSSYNEFRC